ncbi:GIY-YIG nuclease family protein [Roseiarcaceae bacterium H3SJ34-1]|uniref:GIY-YIG nuclease family protein n=1 Tax=Terripilifer ovatus TaxID=3032367 RepID=UPI003AB96ACA|nr:GIY-YIG nuclease family protein [Roseiarcaceae bacterium H3SJ34-1]
MNTIERKAAVAAYKERKVAIGIFAVRCLPTGQTWCGRALDLGAIRNRIWFMLRQNNSRHAGNLANLQAAWNEHGADAFVLEEIERIDDKTLAYVRDRVLKERLAYWCAMRNAQAI